MKIFVAGASGVVGRRLVPMLVQAGHRVVGLTRFSKRVRLLEGLGAEAAIADVFEAAALLRAVEEAQPDVLIHQLTDLSGFADMTSAIERNARIRKVGTANLAAAGKHVSVSRFIAQSIAWAYAPGRQPFREDSRLEKSAEGLRSVTVSGVVALEQAVLAEPEMHPIVLRYGKLYGPETGVDRAPGDIAVHIDAAAHAALLAVERGAGGVYNIADESSTISSERAALELGWRSDFRIAADRNWDAEGGARPGPVRARSAATGGSR